MAKQNDLVLNMLANQNFSVSDFKAVGLNAGNTSLESEDAYKEHDAIKNNAAFKKEDGSFDDVKFHNFYIGAQQTLQYLGDDKYREDLLKQTTFHRDNIFAAPELRKQGPGFAFIKMPNPDRETSGTVRLGKWSENSFSTSEIALTLKVLVNPTLCTNEDGTIDESKAIWHDSPNDSFTTDFWSTRVLATWDEDGEHIDPTSKQKIKHQKGAPKLNANGTYYYENLDGRDVYGKQVLNKFDTLTTDGSAWNKYDFFDSDDKNQKSVFGSIMKNLALCGSMYLPYVGPVIAGISVATLGAGMLSTLGKMLTGSDSPTLSAIEGWSKSVGRQNKTEYAQLNAWCWENFIGLVGDSLALFKEQRFLFETAPALFKGKYGIINEDSMKGLIDKAALKYSNSAMENAIAQKGLQGYYEMSALSNLKATAELESYLKGYQKLGEVLSKTYMTGITVADTYGEAKQLGASDFEATLLTLGYGAAEAALLNTGLGEWLFPELRYNKMHQQAVLKALQQAKGVTKEAEEQIMKQTLKIGKDEAKREYAKRLFNIGKKTAQDLWTASKSTGLRTVSNAVANAAGEGFEEVSEELLADLSKGCFNVVNYLRGDETRMESFDIDWNEEKPETHWDRVFDRYAMSFLGGAIGGGIAGLSLKLIGAIKDLGNMTYDTAVQELVHMIKNKDNGEFDSFMKTLEKTDIGNPNYSATKYTTDDEGHIIWQPGTKEDNQNDAAKKMIKLQVKMIDDILTGNGINMSDDSFLKTQLDLLGDAKYAVVMKNSSAVGRLMLRFNTLGVDIAKLSLELQKPITTTDKQEREENKEESKNKKENSAIDLARKLKLEQLKELQKEKNDLLSGKLTGDYIDAALFELTPMISDNFVPASFSRYAEIVANKKFNEIGLDELNKIKLSYEEWKNSEKGDLILIASKIFKNIINQTSDVIKNHADEYKKATVNPILKGINLFYKKGMDLAIKDWTLQRGKQLTSDTYLQGANDIISAYSYDFDTNLMNLFDNEQLNRINQVTDQINQVFVNPSITNEEKEVLIRSLEKEAKNLFNEFLVSNIEKLTEPIIKLGYLNSEAKIDLVNSLSNAANSLQEQMEPALAILDQVNSRNPEIAELARLAKEKVIQLTDLKNKIIEYRNKIKKLKSTPIEQALNNFSLALTGKPTNVSEVLAAVHNALDPNLGNLEAYSLDTDLRKNIDEALQTIEYFRIALDSARTDNGDFNNLFGFAHSINELNKNLKTEGFEALPEISAEIAEIFKLDLKTLKDKLIFAKLIYDINLGNKIGQQKKASLNKDILFYRKLLTLKVSVPDDWKDKNKFIEALNKLETLNKYQNKWDKEGWRELVDVSEDERKAIQKEMLLAEDAIGDFIRANYSIKNIKTLLSGLNVYEVPKESFNESTQNIDDNSFIWWLATRTALPASVFYKRYQSIIDIDPESKHPIAPIAPLLLAVYSNYASIVNGQVFDDFTLAIREHIKEDWNKDSHTIIDESGNTIELSKQEYRKQKLAELGVDEGSIAFQAKDETAHCVFQWVNAPKYSHITFTEGISGSGKTTAVYRSTLKMLLKYNADSPVLKNVWVIHGASKKLGEKLATDIELENSTVLSLEELMKKINTKWKRPERKGNIYQVDDSSHTFNEDGEIVSSAVVNNGISELANSDSPSLIVIDETTLFTQFDLDDINELGKKLGIQIIAAGDTSLSGIKGRYTFNENELSTMCKNFGVDSEGKPSNSQLQSMLLDKKNNPEDVSENLNLYNRSFIRSAPKLGITMRPTNNHKAKNATLWEAFVQDPNHVSLTGDYTLSAYVGEDGVFGDLVFRSGGFVSDESDLTTNIPGVNYTLEQAVQKMVDTLEDNDIIGYITNDENNQIASALKDKFGDKIVIYPGTTYQGDEFKYAIVDIDNDIDEENPAFPNDLYTAATRATQGDILIIHPESRVSSRDGGMEDVTMYIDETRAQSSYVNTSLDPGVVLEYAKDIKSVYEEITLDYQDEFKYTPRLKLQKINSEEKVDDKKSKGIDDAPVDDNLNQKDDSNLLTPEITEFLNDLALSDDLKLEFENKSELEKLQYVSNSISTILKTQYGINVNDKVDLEDEKGNVTEFTYHGFQVNGDTLVINDEIFKSNENVLGIKELATIYIKAKKGLFRKHKTPEPVVNPGKINPFIFSRTPSISNLDRQKAGDLVKNHLVDIINGHKVVALKISPGESPRIFTVIDINGVNVPFYISTGDGGKKDVPVGKWYACFGISSVVNKNNGHRDMSWINKTSGSKGINQSYGSAAIAAIEEYLNNTYGDLRNDTSIPEINVSNLSVKEDGTGYSDFGPEMQNRIELVASVINKSFKIANIIKSPLDLSNLTGWDITKATSYFNAYVNNNSAIPSEIAMMDPSSQVLYHYIANCLDMLDKAFDEFTPTSENNIDPEEIAKRQLEIKKSENKAKGELYLQENGFKIGDFIYNPETEKAGNIIDVIGLKDGWTVKLSNGNFIFDTLFLNFGTYKTLSPELEDEQYNNIITQLLNNGIILKDNDLDGLTIKFKEDVLRFREIEIDPDSMELVMFFDIDNDPENEYQFSLSEFIEFIDEISLIVEEDPIIELEVENSELPEIIPEESDLNPGDDSELQHQAIASSVDPVNIQPEINTTENRAEVKPLLYTTFSFETGVKPCKMDEVPEQFDLLDATKLKKIDSVNGLLNLDKILGNKPHTLGFYLNVLGEIYSAINDYKDLSKINDALTLIIQKNFDPEGKNPNLVKANSMFGFRIISTNLKEKGNKYDAFIHPITKDIQFIPEGGEDRVRENHRAYLGIRIGFEGLGDVLEMPFINFTNPTTLFQTKLGEELAFKEIYEAYPDLESKYSDLTNGKQASDFVNDVKHNHKKLYDKYKSLFDMFKLYSITLNLWIPLNKGKSNKKELKTKTGLPFTPSGYFINLGPRISGIERGITINNGGVYVDPNFKLPVLYIDISQLASNPRFKISNIMFSQTQTIAGSNGNIVINGSKKLLQKGHPFILYTTCKNLYETYGTNDIAEAWVKQLEDFANNSNAPLRIKMAYVLPPKATLEEFVDFHTADANEQKSKNSIGNDFNSYKIVKELFGENAKNFLNDYRPLQIFTDAALAEIVNVVTNILNDIQEDIKDATSPALITKALYRSLCKEVTLDGDKNSYYLGTIKMTSGLRRKDFLDRLIAALVNPRKLSFNGLGTGFTRSNEAVELIKTYAANALNSLRFHPDASFKSGGTEIIYAGLFWKVRHNDSYAIDGSEVLGGGDRSYQMVGTLDSDIYQVDISELMDYLLGSVHLEPNGMWKMNDVTIEGQYCANTLTASKSRKKILQEIKHELEDPTPEQQGKIKNTNEKLIKSVKYILSITNGIQDENLIQNIEYMSDEELLELAKLAADDINKLDNTWMAMIVDGKTPLVLSNVDLLRESSLVPGEFRLFADLDTANNDPFNTTVEFNTEQDGTIRFAIENNGNIYEVIYNVNDFTATYYPRSAASTLTENNAIKIAEIFQSADPVILEAYNINLNSLPINRTPTLLEVQQFISDNVNINTWGPMELESVLEIFIEDGTFNYETTKDNALFKDGLKEVYEALEQAASLTQCFMNIELNKDLCDAFSFKLSNF